MSVIISAVTPSSSLSTELLSTAEFLDSDSYSIPATSEVLIAQQFQQDVLGDIGEGFNKFVETGQVWALLIGLVLGFVIRGLTR